MGLSAAMNEGYVYVAENSGLSKKTIEIGGVQFKRDDNLTILSPQRDRKLIENLVRESFLRAAKTVGYTGRKGQKLHSETFHSWKYINVYYGFQYEIEVLSDGKTLIWIDPASVWRMPAIKFIEVLKREGLTEKEIADRLVGSKVRVPSVKNFSLNNAVINSVKFVPIGEYQLRDLGTSLYDYWQQDKYKHYLNTNNFTLDYSDTPVLTVKYSGMSTLIDFPAKLCDLHIDLENAKLTKDIGNKLRFATEKDHVTETKKIAKTILGKGLTVGSLNLSFNASLIDWKLENYGTEYKFTIPSLIFGDGQEYLQGGSSEPNIRAALNKYGPVTKRESVNVVVIIPERLKNCKDDLVEYLNEVGIDLKLPVLKIVGTMYTSEPNPDEYRMKARNLKNTPGVDAVIVILDRINEQAIYYEAKRGLGEVFLKSQMLSESTLKLLTDKSNNWRIFTASIIMAQLYGKILKPGESIWHLSRGAGGIPEDEQTFFMGFDVSRNNDLRREAAAYSAICDPLGRVLTRKRVPFKGERVGALDLSEWFFSAALDAYESSNGTKSLDSLVLFKDGDIKENQVSEYVQGCDLAMERMKKWGLMKEDGNIVVIAAIKRGPHRLFGSEDEGYMIKNSAVIRNENEALVVTYGNDPRGKRALRGTPQPTIIKIIHQVRKSMSIEQIIQIFNDLRYLDYSSIMKQPKTILPLHIVQNFAKLIKEGIEVPYDPR